MDSGGYLAIGLKTDFAKPELEQRSFVRCFSVRLVVRLCYPGELKRALLFLPYRRRKSGADEKERQEQYLKPKHGDGRDRLAIMHNKE